MTSKTKKSINITVVESDQVVQHILPLETTEKSRKRNGTPSSGDLTYSTNFPLARRKSQNVTKDSSDSNDEDSMPIDLQSLAIKNDETEPVAGGDVFKFRTPKKSGQMALKAKDSCSPSASKQKQSSKNGSAPGTPKSPGRGTPASPHTPKSQKFSRRLSDAVSDPLTPKQSRGVAALRNHKRMESSTPYRLRKRNLHLEQPATSSDDSVDESSSEDDNDDNEDGSSGPIATDSGTTNGDINMGTNAEAYFDLHAMAPVTSDRTLSALDGPRLDVDTIHEVLKNVDIGHRKQMDKLMKDHAKLFDKWMFNMCCGYNILLHGLGSKRTLLEKFREQHLVKFSHLVINGYFPSLMIKHILNSITEEILGNTKGFSNNHSQVEFIRDTFKTRNEDFYLLIHNIDGILLRSDKSQVILSHLAEIKGFHIIASVDHINAVFMWDQNKYFRFHWLWYETPTFMPYEAENSYENSLMVQQSGALALSSIVHVMRSLTPNARRVFLMLAEYQMEVGDNPNYPGMSFQSLYHKCREAFLVNSDLTLQAQLVEFKDHRLIRSKKNFEGIEHLVIPVERTTLKEFLQEHKDGHS